MRISHPGRFGDSLWTGPTLRAIAAAHGPVDLVLSRDYGRDDFLDLWRAQPYIKSASRCDEWEIREEAPIQPWEAPMECDAHLGYRGWPQAPTLYEEAYRLATEQLGPLPALDMSPWMVVKAPAILTPAIVCAFSFHWAELKAGVVLALANRFRGQSLRTVPKFGMVLHDGRRWSEFETKDLIRCPKVTWIVAAQVLQQCQVVLCDLSGMWVLANALGKPTVVCEPMEGRARSPLFWNPSPLNHMTLGGDGQSTFDSTAVGDLLEVVLKEVNG